MRTKILSLVFFGSVLTLAFLFLGRRPSSVDHSLPADPVALQELEETEPFDSSRSTSTDQAANLAVKPEQNAPYGLAELPHHARPEEVVLDRSVERGPDGSLVVKTLTRRPDRKKSEVFYEERFDLQDGVWIRLGSSVARGGEALLDASPEKIDPEVLTSFIEANQLEISWKAKFSDHLRLRAPEIDVIADHEAFLRRVVEAFSPSVAEPDYLRFPSQAFPSDWNASLMWHLEVTRAADAWQFGTGSEEVVIAVVDTGMTPSHPDLRDNLWKNPRELPGNGKDDDGNGLADDVSGWDFFNDTGLLTDTSGHGTHVSGVVAASGDNGLGVTGVGWKVKILPLRAGEESLSTSSIIDCLDYVATLKRKGVNIVATNNSYGSGGSSNASRNAIREHERLGILFVAAAGNGDDEGKGYSLENTPEYPAAYPLDNVIAVANSNQSDRLAQSSNYGAKSVDLSAPGENIYSTYSNGEYAFLSGTSMASPMVAGTVALIASREPELSAVDIKKRILDTVDALDSLAGITVSGGRLNILKAVKPSLTEHRIGIGNHPGEIIISPDRSIPIDFEIDAMDGAEVTLEARSGENDVSVENLGGDRFRARFARNGWFPLVATATAEGLSLVAERFVVVGPVGDVVEGAIHDWRFEEADGMALEDRAGTGAGTLFGPTRVPTPLGRGLHFSTAEGKSSDKVRFRATPSPRITLSAFVKVDDLRSSSHPRILNLPDNYIYFSSRGEGPATDGNSDTFKFFSNRPGIGVWNTPPDTAVVGDWVHVAATYDSASTENEPKLFINGRRMKAWVQSLPNGTQTKDGGEAFIGNRDDDGRPFDGQMDEARVFNRQLSADEVRTMAARCLDARWSQARLSPETEIIYGKPVTFAFEDSNGGSPDAEYSWSILGGKNSKVASTDGSSAEIVFSSTLAAKVVLQVSDEWLTRYYDYDVAFDAIKVDPGTRLGEVESGGLVWIDIDEEGKGGAITLLDAKSGFYRRNEPIEIAADGSFFTLQGSSPRLSGNLLDGFSGTVEGRDIAFSGEELTPVSIVSPHVGSYSGGEIGKAGQSLTLRVLENGQIFAARHGFDGDLANGFLDNAGSFSGTTALGLTVELDFDLDSGQARGTWGDNPVFAERSDARVNGPYRNLSTLGNAGLGEASMIGGFVINGASPRPVLIRAIGPGLEDFGVSAFAKNPLLELYDSSGSENPFARNEIWTEGKDFDGLVTLANELGAFALKEGSTDAALRVELPAGLYTAVVSGEADGKQVLLEIYDAGDSNGRLENVATRGRVVGEASSLTAGFVIGGDAPKQVLIRAAGPALFEVGVADFLEDPRLDLFDDGKPSPNLLAGNRNWSATEGASVSGSLGDDPAIRLAEAMLAAGAFDFAEGSQDAALLVWLEPGLYTARSTGPENKSGIVLIEVYELPSQK